MTTESCVFCEIVAGRAPASKVYEDDLVIAFFPLHPVNEYHTLVIPKRHATDIFNVGAEDFAAVAAAIRHISRAYKETLGIDDVQILSSNGADAQQDVFHLHFHIVPRSKGDGQDMIWTPDLSIGERFDELLSRVDVGPMKG